MILDYRPISVRRFGRWSMAFENLSDPKGQALTLSDLRVYLQKKFQLPEERDILPHMLSAFSEQSESVAV